MPDDIEGTTMARISALFFGRTLESSRGRDRNRGHAFHRSREGLFRDPTFDELKDFIDSLNIDEQIDLVALTWLGRGDGTKNEWSDLVQQAKDSRSDHTAEYLLGIPLLGDYLEEALSQLGFFCDEEEIGHL
jgi:hypothetical protein